MKNELRKFAKEKRHHLDIETLSEKIIDKLINLDEYKNSKNILNYYSFGFEICTHKCFEDKTKNWFLPRINIDDLDICPFNCEKLTKNKYGILEPSTTPINDINLIDMIIIPSICSDRNGYRIGYGKGFYDRLLKKLNNDCIKVILTYSDFFFDNVYPDEYDEKGKIIITDKEIYKI